MKIAISVFITVLFSISANANDICRADNFTYFNTKIQTGVFAQTKRCYISIAPMRYQNMTYRSHIFTSIGEHMIFNSFGFGPARDYTGARVYLYLPRTQAVSYKLVNAKLELTLANGSTITIDAKSSQIIDSTGLDIQETPTINRNNAGGVEVYSAENTYIDFGFTLGYSPLWDLNGRHDIYLKDQTCNARNSELLFKRNGEIFWIYQTDQELITKLNSLCAQ